MTTPVVEVLTELLILGVRIAVQGDCLRFAPKGRVSRELAVGLQEHKSEVLAAMTAIAARRRPVSSTAAQSIPASKPVIAGDDEPSQRASQSTRVSRSDNDDVFEDVRPVGIDGWPCDTVDPWDVDPCTRCGSLELWDTMAGSRRCMHCDPPIRSRQLAMEAMKLRHESNSCDETEP